MDARNIGRALGLDENSACADDAPSEVFCRRCAKWVRVFPAKAGLVEGLLRCDGRLVSQDCRHRFNMTPLN